MTSHKEKENEKKMYHQVNVQNALIKQDIDNVRHQIALKIDA